MRRCGSLLLGLVPIAFLLAGCGGIASYQEYKVGDKPSGLAFADVNGDGRQDVLVTNAGSSTVTVRLQGKHGDFDASYTMQLPKDAHPSAIVVGTFRASGKPTAVVANRGGDSISIFNTFGPGATPTKTISLGPGAAPAALAVGNVDGDADTDLLVTSRQPTFPGCQSKGCVLVFKDKGDGLAYSYAAYPVGTSETIDYEPVSIAVGQVWPGGRPEIVVANRGTKEAVVMETVGAGFEQVSKYSRMSFDVAPLAVQLDSGLLEVTSLGGSIVWVTGAKDKLIRMGKFGHPGVLVGGRFVDYDADAGKLTAIDLLQGPDTPVTSPILKGLTWGAGDLDGPDGGLAVALKGDKDSIVVFFPQAHTYAGPDSLSLGKVAVGGTGTGTVKARIGTDVPTHLVPKLSGPDASSFAVEGCGPVGNGESCALKVTFAPTSPGAKKATITLGMKTDDASAGNQTFVGRAPTIALTGTATAGAGGTTRGEPLAVGTTDDFGKYADDAGASFFSSLREVGMSVNRMDVLWHAGQTAPDATETSFLDRSVAQAQQSGVRVVFSVYSATARDHDPGQMCAFARWLADRYPSVKDFVIGNEPNKADFWSPVDPAAYTKLLATCYDQLHPLGVSVAGGALSARQVGSGLSPVQFVAEMGVEYDLLNRSEPIMDTFSFHPYPNPEAIGKGVQAGYEWPNAGIPNLDRVKQAVQDAFHDTKQPTFATGLTLSLDEAGWQAAIMPQYASLYSGSENAATVDEAAQAANDAALVNVAACDPLVSDLLFFHFVDEKGLASGATSGGWQSGLLRADLSRRPAFDATKAAIAAGCSGAPHPWTPASSVVGGSITLGAVQQQVRWRGKKQPGVKFTVGASSDEGVAWTLTVKDAAGKTVATKRGTRTAPFDTKTFTTPVLVGSGSWTATMTMRALYSDRALTVAKTGSSS
jgi:hypothetical protein